MTLEYSDGAGPLLKAAKKAEKRQLRRERCGRYAAGATAIVAAGVRINIAEAASSVSIRDLRLIGSSVFAEFRRDPLPEAADFIGRFAERGIFADRKTRTQRVLVIVAHHDEGLRDDVGEIEAASSPSAVAAPLMRWPRIGVWLRTKANGLFQARAICTVDAVASMSAMLGRAGIRHRSE